MIEPCASVLRVETITTRPTGNSKSDACPPPPPRSPTMPRILTCAPLTLLAALLALGACDTTTGGQPGPATDVIVGDTAPPPADTVETTPPSDTVGVPVELTLTAVDPERGSTTGLDEVQLQGTGFTGVTQVLFGESPAIEFFVVHDRLIVAMAPPRPSGLVDVIVIDEDGGLARLDRGYNYKDDVQVTLVEPARGHWLGGEPITVYGAGFAAGATVVIGGRAAPVIQVVDAQTITAITPAGAPGPAEIYVSSADGVGRYAPGFLYDGGPRVDVVTPTGGPLSGGYPVTIRGAGFYGTVTAKIGGRLVTDVRVDSAGLLTGTVPPGAIAGSADVTLITESGTALAAGAFHYLGAPDPPFALLSVHPTRGALSGGEQVALAVTGLTPAGGVPVVEFGGRGATVTGWDAAAMSVVVTAPAGVSPGPVTVTVRQDAGVGALAGAWTYLDTPRIDAVSPATGPAAGGTTVTLTGAGFAPGAAVRVGALPATAIQVIDATHIQAVTGPGSPGPADVRVTQAGLDAVRAGAFTYQGQPAVWVVDPPAGAVAGGTRVRILGTGFPVGQAVEVSFGGAAASNVNVIDMNTIEARTPRGFPGPVAVRVKGGDVDATHPNGFSYFDPASFPGTWGDPIDGTLNVTVIDSSNGGRVTGATVVVGTAGATTFNSSTNDRGQVTFSAASLLGDQIVTATKSGYQTAQIAGFDATNVTLALDPIPTCSDIGDVPCDQITEPGPVAYLEAHIIGSAKAPTLPWGECRDYLDVASGLCQPCGTDDDCLGAGQRCAELPGQGFSCTNACESDLDCADTFRCQDVTNEGQAKQCVPPPGEIRVYCDITNPDMYADDAIAYPGVLVNATTNSVYISTRLGNYAAFCWRGQYVRGEFRPEVMGVTRHLGAFANGDQVVADVAMDIPLKRHVSIAVDAPPMGTPGEATTTVMTYLNLRGDGVLPFPPLTDTGGTAPTFEEKLPELTGVLHDAAWDFFVQVDVPSLGGYSASEELGIDDIADDLDLALGPDGWELHADVPATTRGISTRDGEVLAVGDGGRIAQSFGDNHWALQASGTDRDLYAVDAFASDAAVAVGAGGVATHWDGFLWHVADTGVFATLEAVSMPAADEAWAVGGGKVLRWSGGAWSLMFDADVPLHGVLALASNDVWVVGDGGYVARFNGLGWIPVETGVAATLNAIWGAVGVGPVVAGDGGVVLRFGDGAFTRDEVPTVHDLLALCGEGDGDIYAVGARGAVLHFDGEAWRDESHPDHKATLRAVGGPAEKLRAMGSHELVLGPILGIPDDLDPPDGSFLDKRLRWTVTESIEPHFTLLDFSGAAGPCFACGAYFMLPYSSWRAVLDGDLNEAWFPINSASSIGGLGFAVESLTIYRVLVDDKFDFDHTSNNGFYNVAWKSWAVRGATYIR
ncbi:MAG: hypothetical protein CVU56_15985 [Deltaproteobacteria bacterium HGW-Deltaproteobacteria-14]|nr:MAG: hypothetical protein CVU56_15985 [Deltaproteobacteria bacterium HGW-Deltaproteobacteria-14]